MSELSRGSSIDEDETIELVRLGGGVTLIPHGIDMALARNRSRYLDGHIDVEEFETELDRLMRKRAAVLAGCTHVDL